MSVRLQTRVNLAALLLVLAVSPVWSQVWAGRGRLQGQVKDQQGNPVAGAKVILRPGAGTVSADAPGPAPVITDQQGKWSILGLAGGAWGVLIEKEGFNSSEGRVNVTESGPPSPPINVELKAAQPSPPQQQAPAPTKASEAVAAIEQGNTLLKAGQYADARAQYQKALDLLDPQYRPGVLRGIASTYYKEAEQAKTKEEKSQKTDQAIATLKQALDIKPDDADSLQLIINLLVDAGREQEAQVYMARLPQGTKVDTDTLLNVGIKYYNEKKLDKALEAFNHVISDNPQLADPYYYRGLVYLNQNKTAEAKADFQKLLEIDPKNKFAQEARDYLKALSS